MIDNTPVKYGDLIGSVWRTYKGVDDPQYKKFQSHLDKIKWNYEYQLWLIGGALTGRETYDIDLSLVGPYNPPVIKEILYDLTKIGYDIETWVDAKYVDSLFSMDIHLDESWGSMGKPEIEVNAYSGESIQAGEPLRAKVKREEIDGLYRKVIPVPGPKQIKNMGGAIPPKLIKGYE